MTSPASRRLTSTSSWVTVACAAGAMSASTPPSVATWVRELGEPAVDLEQALRAHVLELELG
jgi:hypothetical protein